MNLISSRMILLFFFDSDLFTNKQPAIFERAVQGVTKAVEKLSLTLPINVLKEKSLDNLCHLPSGYACFVCTQSMNVLVTLYSWPMPLGLNFVVALQGSPVVLIVVQLRPCDAMIPFSCRSRSSLITRIRLVSVSWQLTGHDTSRTESRPRTANP